MSRHSSINLDSSTGLDMNCRASILSMLSFVLSSVSSPLSPPLCVVFARFAAAGFEAFVARCAGGAPHTSKRLNRFAAYIKMKICKVDDITLT